MFVKMCVSVLAGMSIAFFIYGIEGLRFKSLKALKLKALSFPLDEEAIKTGDLKRLDFANNWSYVLSKKAQGMYGEKRRRRQIEACAEFHLPEFSETLLMGLRAGLSFDRAFFLYHDRFDDDLALLCAEAQRRWESGLMSREESLVKLGEESHSELMIRLITNINRSMKLGSSLVRILEVFSSEARSCHKAKMEEKIAKVAVKMMIPTTICILPSMLILILGPILLSMAD